MPEYNAKDIRSEREDYRKNPWPFRPASSRPRGHRQTDPAHRQGHPSAHVLRLAPRPLDHDRPSARLASGPVRLQDLVHSSVRVPRLSFYRRSCEFLPRHLRRRYFAIQGAGCKQLPVSSATRDLSVVKNDDAVRIQNSIDSLRDDNHRAARGAGPSAPDGEKSPVLKSSAEKLSSKIYTGGRRTRARAIARRCFWPPETFEPPSAIGLSYPPSFSTINPSACAILAAFAQLCLIRVILAVFQIRSNRSGHQDSLLGNIADLMPKLVLAQFSDINPLRQARFRRIRRKNEE